MTKILDGPPLRKKVWGSIRSPSDIVLFGFGRVRFMSVVFALRCGACTVRWRRAHRPKTSVSAAAAASSSPSVYASSNSAHTNGSICLRAACLLDHYLPIWKVQIISVCDAAAQRDAVRPSEGSRSVWQNLNILSKRLIRLFAPIFHSNYICCQYWRNSIKGHFQLSVRCR